MPIPEKSPDQKLILRIFIGLVSIPENSPVQTLVFGKPARDPDSGRNGEVRYRILKECNRYNYTFSTFVFGIVLCMIGMSKQRDTG